jgi:hypothetical protein
VGFPAEVNPEEGLGGLFKTGTEHLEKSANLASKVWSNLRAAWKLEGDLRGNDAKRVCRARFRYCIAIAHAPQYESDHKDLLAHDWPHIPLAKEKKQFDKTVMLGEEVAQLLDPLADPSPVLKALLGDDAKTLGVVERNGGGSISESELAIEYSYYGAATGKWDERSPKETETLHPAWGDVTGNLYLNDAIFLSHVPKEVWQYELGGYPVLKKWLGYRQADRRGGAPLLLKELDDFRGIVLRIAAMLMLRPMLDRTYEDVSAASWLIDELI